MKSTLQILAIAVAMGVCALNASAQHYPVKPIRMVIGFPPGGGTDIVGRIVAQKLAEEFGQAVTPDNRGGGAGQIAAEIVAHAPPDGYTILMAHIASLSILPSLVKLPYDPVKDFAPVKLLHSPAVKLAMANVGAEVVGNSPGEFAAYIASERTKYARIVKDANIKMD